MMETSIRLYRVAERDPRKRDSSRATTVAIPGWKDPVAVPKKTTP